MARYRVFFHQSENPSTVSADTLVDAQRKAGLILAELQAKGCLKGWTISTVVDDPA